MPGIGMRLCTERIPDDSFGIFTDASSGWGAGIVIGREYDSFKLSDGWEMWDGEKKDIGWAEFAAVELAIYFLVRIHNLRDRHILIHVDNDGVIGAWKNRSSRNPAQNAVLARVLRRVMKAQCWITMVYIPSARNPADAPSRGQPLPGYTRTSFPGFPSHLRGIFMRA